MFRVTVFLFYLVSLTLMFGICVMVGLIFIIVFVLVLLGAFILVFVAGIRKLSPRVGK